MIYRLLTTFILLYTLITNPPYCCAVQKGTIEYDGSYADYTVLSPQKVLKKADTYFDKYETTGEIKYLTTAMGNYYIVSKIQPNNLYNNVQLARTYDENKNDALAKKYFNIGINLEKNNPYLNYYYGDFYFKRQDYKRALRHFKVSYKNGYSENHDLTFKIATIYEKFADLSNANKFYKLSLKINPKDEISKDKINTITSLNYDKSQYYKGNKQ